MTTIFRATNRKKNLSKMARINVHSGEDVREYEKKRKGLTQSIKKKYAKKSKTIKK